MPKIAARNMVTAKSQVNADARLDGMDKIVINVIRIQDVRTEIAVAPGNAIASKFIQSEL